eukprot:594706_1
MSPSKELAQCVRNLGLQSQSDSENECKIADNSSNRNTKLQNIQQKLLTQEIKDTLIGRETEYETIHSFIKQQLDAKQADSLYLCGSPGTGKSATISMIIRDYTHHKHVQNIIKINGMSLNNPLAIYSILYSKINAKAKDSVCAKNAKNKLEKQLINTRSSKMYLIIVDEMDGLLESSVKNQQPLYDLFGWTKRTNCKFILIGIANSIDLVDRFLPRLKQRHYEPELLIFKPYTKGQLTDIVKHRLDGEWSDYFEEIAIKLCAQKVAKMYGDVRKLLEIVRNALNVLILDSGIEKVGFRQMKQILANSFESPVIDIIKNLPNQQKTILVIACILMNKTKQKCIIYNKLQQFYQFMAKKYILQKISSREFSVIIDSLISDHIVKIIAVKKGTQGRHIRVLSNDTQLQITVSTADIKFALQNDNVLHKFFEMDIVIPRKFIN